MLWCLFTSFNVFFGIKVFKNKEIWIVCDSYNYNAQFLICCNLIDLNQGSYFMDNVFKYKHFWIKRHGDVSTDH